MPTDQVNEGQIVLKFGGGLNTSAAVDEVRGREAVDGENYALDIVDRQLKPRAPFDKIGQVPNGQEIRGLVSLKKTNNETSAVVQAGGKLYEWDGGTDFTEIADVNRNARLRGRIEHFWELGNKVLVSDLELREPVGEWDGSDYTTMNTSLETPFFAKYIEVANERAFYANIISNSTPTPNLLAGSRISDNETLSVDDKPSTAIGQDDPFFLVMPDLKSINGIVKIFGIMGISTERGQFHRLSGNNAQNFSIDSLYRESGAVGNESLVFIGNDVAYGRQGRIESLKDTDRFGNVQRDDLSLKIEQSIASVRNWTNVFNQRTLKGYYFPADQPRVWQFDPSLQESNLSPWIKWTTEHISSFQPTAVMPMFDPSDGLEYIFFGDAEGNFYRLEGTGFEGDAGSESIKTRWRSKLLSLDTNADVYAINGYVKYLRASEDFTINIQFRFSGETAFNQEINIDVPKITGGSFFNNEAFFGGDFFFNAPFRDRLIRQPIQPAGQNNDVQVQVTVDSKTAWALNEIGIGFNAATQP